MIDKFLARTLAYDALMVDAVRRHGFMLVDVLQSNVTELTERCLSKLDIDERWVSPMRSAPIQGPVLHRIGSGHRHRRLGRQD